MLMERRDDTYVPASEWQDFLRRAFAANLPYDQLVTQILSADGTDPTTRGAAKFYLDRLADPNLLTRDVGRMFLGRDFQCAQCHDHPLIDDYKQAHYYGIFAFLNRTSLVGNRHENRSAHREGRRRRDVYLGLQEESHAQNRSPHPGRPANRRAERAQGCRVPGRPEQAEKGPPRFLATAVAPSWPGG